MGCTELSQEPLQAYSAPPSYHRDQPASNVWRSSWHLPTLERFARSVNRFVPGQSDVKTTGHNSTIKHQQSVVAIWNNQHPVMYDAPRRVAGQFGLID